MSYGFRSVFTLLVGLILLLPPSVARLRAAAVHEDQCYGETFGATTVGCSMTVAAGNSYAAFVMFTNGGSLSSISDGGNSFTLVNNHVELNTIRAAMGYLMADGSSGSITYTATFSGSVSAWITVHEVSGVDVFDGSAMQSQVAPGTGTDAVSSGSITTTENGAYIFGGTTQAGFNSPTITAGTNFTNRTNPFNITVGNTESRIQSTAGSVAATFTTNGADDYITGIIAFQPDTGGGGGPTNCNLLLLRVGC